MQEDALKNAGCEEIYTDVISGVKSQRPGLDQALSYAREGDISNRPLQIMIFLLPANIWLCIIHPYQRSQ